MADDEGGSGALGLFKAHPLGMGLAVAGVALVAWLTSRGGSSSGAAVVPQPAADPNAGNNAAAIEEANISAGAANAGTFAALLGSQGQVAGALRSSLAQTEVARQTGLAEIEAELEATESNNAANVSIAGINANAATAAASITAQAQAASNQQQAQPNPQTTVPNNTLPSAIQLFGSMGSASAPPRVGAGASIFGVPSLAGASASSASQQGADDAAQVGGISGSDIKNMWKKAVAWFGL